MDIRGASSATAAPRCRIPAAIYLIAALLWTSVWAAPSIPTPDLETAAVCAVDRIVDGDTVVLVMNGVQTKVRLIGVDTPETVHPQKPVEAFGKEASAFLSNLLRGESVYVVFEEGRNALDKYGRTLAHLYRVPDALFVNLEIVRQGYGHAYTRYPFEHMELFRYYEQQARETGRGLWAASAVEAPSSAVPQVAAQPAEADPAAIDNQAVVYMTNSGSKYHLEGCRYLSKSKVAISLIDAKARGLTACSVCRPPN